MQIRSHIILCNADPEFEESHHYQPKSLPDRNTDKDTVSGTDKDRGRKHDKQKQDHKTVSNTALSKEESKRVKTDVSSFSVGWDVQCNQQCR